VGENETLYLRFIVFAINCVELKNILWTPAVKETAKTNIRQRHTGEANFSKIGLYDFVNILETLYYTCIQSSRNLISKHLYVL